MAIALKTKNWTMRCNISACIIRAIAIVFKKKLHFKMSSVSRQSVFQNLVIVGYFNTLHQLLRS